MKAETIEQLSILTDVYDRLVETQETIDDASQQIENNFRESSDTPRFFINPIGYKVTLQKTIDDARVSFTDFVVDQANADYKNLRIDRGEMQTYTNEHGFDAETLVGVIKEKYADEDKVTLQQIKTTLEDILPWRGGRQIETPDELTKIKDTGFELRIHGYEFNQRERVAAVVKLVDIVLRDVAPSKVNTKAVEIGKVYKDDKVKSLRYFKNGALKVVFYTVDDCEKVKTAMFAEA